MFVNEISLFTSRICNNFNLRKVGIVKEEDMSRIAEWQYFTIDLDGTKMIRLVEKNYLRMIIQY